VLRAGLDDITFHGLRHSFVAIMVAAGCNVREVSEWAGHNSVAFTLTMYGGLFEDNTDAAIDRLDALLGGFRESREAFPSATNPLAVPQLRTPQT
jgi:integrase